MPTGNNHRRPKKKLYPYGTTARNEWDKKIPFEPLWEERKRILKPNGVVALWSQQPFTSELVMSNPKWFRYEWIIEKTKGTSFLNAKKMPLKAHENVLIFYKTLPIYYPQKTTGHKPVHKKSIIPIVKYVVISICLW